MIEDRLSDIDRHPQPSHGGRQIAAKVMEHEILDIAQRIERFLAVAPCRVRRTDRGWEQVLGRSRDQRQVLMDQVR